VAAQLGPEQVEGRLRLPITGFEHRPAHDVGAEVGDLQAGLVGPLGAHPGLEDPADVDDVLGDVLAL
jgi:hypothetical protein